MTTRTAGGENPVVLVLDGDRDRATLAARALTGPERVVLTSGDAVVGGLVGRRLGLSSLVTEAQIGPFTFDGLDAVADVHRSAPSCRIVVTGQPLPDDVAAEAVRRGAYGILPRPFGPDELRTRFGLLHAQGEDGVVLHIPTVEELVTSDALLPAFQPIVDLADAACRGVGFESLARYRAEDLLFCDPAFLFEYARLCGRTAELDLACLRRTLSAARELPPRGKIFINVHPRVVADGDRFARTLADAASANDIPLDRVVLEITEQEKLEPTESTLPAIEDLRAAGVQFALDDVGMSYSHLDLISRIRPAYLKISHEFGTDFEKDPSRKKIIRNIQSLARDFECEVILEGVESEETSRAAADIGARYAQGFFYARPADARALECGNG